MLRMGKVGRPLKPRGEVMSETLRVRGTRPFMDRIDRQARRLKRDLARKVGRHEAARWLIAWALDEIDKRETREAERLRPSRPR
jgi:hypothetical protein